MTAFQAVDGEAALQEVYRHLDGPGASGNQLIAWYGQERAVGKSHAAAMQATIDHYGLRYREWYLRRFPEQATP